MADTNVRSETKLAKVYDVGGCKSIQTVLEESHTNWDAKVIPADIMTTDDAGNVVKVASCGSKAIVRPDTMQALSYVGQRYRANSHRQQLYGLDKLVESGDIVPTSVSMWDNGATLAYQFRAPGLDVTIRDRDLISPLLTLAFAFGSQIADMAFFTDFRWFCKNQMGQVAKLNDAGSRVKHRGDVYNKFGDVLQRRLGELSGELSDHYKAMRMMADKPMPVAMLPEFYGEILGMSKDEVELSRTLPREDLTGKLSYIPEILDCYAVDDANAPGTVWHAYNAFTRHETHKVGRNEATRQRRMLLGSGDVAVRRAFDVAARMAA